MDIRELDQAYVAHSYGRFPLQIDHGKGAELFDEKGKRYIDLGSGIAVNTFGACDEVWQQAVTAQLGKLQHASNLYYTAPCAKLAAMLCERTGMKKVFFGNSGGEANECAIKTARRWAFQKYGDESHATIITLKNSFHGRTITTLAATGQDVFHTEFGPFTQGFVYADAHDAASVRRLAEENQCCAVMMELVQGEGGVNALSQAFVDEVLAIAREKDLLIVIDEVQTGNGRTGKLYSFMHYGFTPDIFTTAKGLAGGLPLGACVFGEKTAEVLTPGSHGSTFGGNPVCCAGAISVLERLDDGFLAAVEAKSAYIRGRLAGAKGVKSVSGLGLMVGIESEKDAKAVVSECMARGVIPMTAKNKVRLLPPLSITEAQLAEAMDILLEVLAQ